MPHHLLSHNGFPLHPAEWLSGQKDRLIPKMVQVVNVWLGTAK